jgi:hypothetical protein
MTNTDKLKSVQAALISANKDLLKGEFDGEIQALKDVIESFVQKPVAIVDEDGVIVVCNYKYKPGDKFYTTPAAAPVPLTDEQIDTAWLLNGGGLAAYRYYFFARAIEAAHGITKGQQ